MNLPGMSSGDQLKRVLAGLSPPMAKALDGALAGTIKADIAVRLGLPEDAKESRIVARLQESPELPQVIRDVEGQATALLRENDVSLAALEFEEREAARERFGDNPWVMALAYLLVLLSFTGIGFIMWAETFEADALNNSTLMGNIVTVLSNTIAAMLGFYFGSKVNNGNGK